MKAIRAVALGVFFLALCLPASAQTAKKPVLIGVLPQTGSSRTVVLKWTAATGTGVTQNVYRETSVEACTSTSVGTGPGCLKLNATPLDTTVATFNDTISSASSCSPATATCAPPGTYSYVVRGVNPDGSNLGQVESNSVAVSLSSGPSGLTATPQ